MKYFYCFFMLVTLSLSPFCFGDQIILINGDRLTGEVVSLVTDTLRLKTDYAGLLNIKRDKIKTLETENPAYLLLESGEVYYAKIQSLGESELHIHSPEIRSIGISLTELLRMSLEPFPPSVADSIPIKPRADLWKGFVSILGQAQMGNKETLSYFIKGESKYFTDSMQFTLRGEGRYGERSGEVDTTELRGQLNIRKYIIPDGYLFGDILMEHDRFEEIEYRVDSAVGAGYRFINLDRTEFLSDMGIGLTYEQARDMANSYFTEPTLRFGLEWNQKLFEKAKLSHIMTLYPNLGLWGDVRLISETTFQTPIYESLSWTVNITDEYDSQTSNPEIKNNDLSVRTGLQYNF